MGRMNLTKIMFLAHSLVPLFQENQVGALLFVLLVCVFLAMRR